MKERNLYRLRKDCPGFKKDDLFSKGEKGYLFPIDSTRNNYIKDFDKDDNFNDWFEIVQPKKIKILISQNGDSKEIEIETHNSPNEVGTKITESYWL